MSRAVALRLPNRTWKMITIPLGLSRFLMPVPCRVSVKFDPSSDAMPAPLETWEFTRTGLKKRFDGVEHEIWAQVGVRAWKSTTYVTLELMRDGWALASFLDHMRIAPEGSSDPEILWQHVRAGAGPETVDIEIIGLAGVSS